MLHSIFLIKLIQQKMLKSDVKHYFTTTISSKNCIIYQNKDIISFYLIYDVWVFYKIFGSNAHTGSLLGQRHRRWTNIDPAWDPCQLNVHENTWILPGID